MDKTEFKTYFFETASEKIDACTEPPVLRMHERRNCEEWAVIGPNRLACHLFLPAESLVRTSGRTKLVPGGRAYVHDQLTTL